MATGSKNAKSQSLTARVPHSVVEGMESVRREGESNAAFIVKAIQGEIIRRQLAGNAESNFLSALDTLGRVEEIGVKAGEEIKSLVSIARDELKRQKHKKPKG